MERQWRRLFTGLFLVSASFAQTNPPAKTLTWQQIESQFEANNPTLLADKVNIDEARADEITAYLRPNPNLNIIADDLGVFTYHPFQRTANGIFAESVDYLHERRHKRELRLQSAQEATAVAISTQTDLERNLLYNLRDAFVRVLLAKAVVELAQENMKHYDKEIEINKSRLDAGAMARVDFTRVQLQRVQYQADLATARVNLRIAKIDLFQFLRDRTPVDEFDVQESFDFEEPAVTMDELKNSLEQLRPYKDHYLKEAADARETVSFSFLPGAASLLDFPDAQRAYRDTELSYLNLVGAYMSAANQLNFAVGREVIR